MKRPMIFESKMKFGSLVLLVIVAFPPAVAVSQERQTPTAIPLGETPPPWASDAPAPPRLPVRELAGPRQLLELFNIDASQLDRFVDGRPLHSDEYEPLYRVLYRIPRFPRDRLLEWRLRDVDWAQFAARPEEQRVASLRLTGRVARIEREALLPEAAALLEFDHFYRVWLETDNAPFPALVCSRWLPRAWKVGEDVNYRASVDGLFLKMGETDAGHPQLVVACDRVAWHPDRPAPELGVTEDHVLLASLGMDLGQFDLVLDRRDLTGVERECFYQLLDAARRVDADALRKLSGGEADLAPLVMQPRELRGSAVTLTGQARRVQTIRVEDRDIRQRFGIDHYYEIDVFVPLEGQSIKMGEEADAPVFTNYYPVIFCVATLPKGMTPDEVLDREVRIPAFYFKIWAYETQFMKQHGDRAEQLSPMLIGHAPEVLAAPERPRGFIGTIAAAVFVVVLAFTWVWLWRVGRRDETFDRELRRRRFAVDDKQTLDHLQAEQPDFSNLRAEDE